MGTIVSAIVDGILQSVFGWISSVMEKRGLIQQGREAQHSDDLQASVTEAKSAAKTSETVDAMPDAELDAALERVQHPAGHS